MKYKCLKCGFIHEGKMPDGYICPLCHATLFDFKIIEEEEKKYNRVLINEDNLGINRIEEKCINCGMCSKTCSSVFANNEKCDGLCLNCGQCILTCPKAALTPKYNYNKVIDYINDDNYHVVALVSPAVRVGIGDAFNETAGKYLDEKLVASLKQIGFDYVFDTTFGADLTSMEEAYELKKRIEENKTPMFSSCCPSWVKYLSVYHPELLDNLSTCKSPIGMMSTIIKEYYAKEEDYNDNLIIVAITPCTSKKFEIVDSDCDVVITTSELALMIRELNIDFINIEGKEFDTLKGSSSGVSYGASGGVTSSVLKILFHDQTKRNLTSNELLVTNHKYYKEYRLKLGKRICKCACVSTMENFEKLLLEKDSFDFIEVMNCEGGCISGGGQILMPIADRDNIKTKRRNSILSSNKKLKLKYPYSNPLIKDLYEDFLGEPNSELAEKLLHTTHNNLSYLNIKNEV